MMKVLLGVTASLFLLTSHAALAEGDAEAGQQKSVTCAACHGTDGNSVVAMWPKIAGQHEQYLARHIQLIKDTALNPDEDLVWVAGLRGRLAF